MANEKGVWRTIGGRRVFIKEGQDLASAMKESGKFKSASKISKKDEDDIKKSMQKVAEQYEQDKKEDKVAERLKENEANERKIRSEAIDNQKWLTEKDEKWLREQGHKEELENKIKNFKPSGDIENDERKLEDISSNYFYDEVGIYNENIDSTATKWAHDKAVELNEKNQRAEERKNATKGAGTTSQDKVLEDFKNSDGSKKNFEKALNKISEMEYNNEINPDEYKDYISKIQKEYVEKNRKANSDREALRNTEERKNEEDFQKWRKNNDANGEWTDEKAREIYENTKPVKYDIKTKSYEEVSKEDYKEKSTNDIMNEKIRGRGKSKEEDDLPKRTEIKSQGTSNRKEVSENIQAHILDYYSSDFTGEDIPATEAFVRQMDAMDWLPNNWKRGEEIAKGGSYLIYNQDMADFLDELKINPKGKTFSEDKAFDMYTSLIGRESAKLYDRIQKNSYKKYMKSHPLSKMSFEEFKDMNKK